MSLYSQLQQAKSKEDVKDAYIKALGLKSYTKGLIDIRTKEIWFEAQDTGKHSSYAMFTQLLHYVQDALNKGEEVPPFLAVIDTEKAALMKSTDVLPFLKKKTVVWGKSASQYTQEALLKISTHNSKVFDGIKGDFPIGFLVWATNQNAIIKQPIIEIETEVFDKNMRAIGEKSFYNLPNNKMLTNWIGRQKPNEIEVLPPINAVTPSTRTKGVRRTQWSEGAIGHMLSDSNDLQNAGQATALFSSVHSIGHKGGFFVTDKNLWQAAIIFSVGQADGQMNSTLQFSHEVLDAGRILWQAYFADTNVRIVRNELKLNRADVGWYQIRNALKKRNESGDAMPVDFTPFETIYKTLTEKRQLHVFELGFLR